MFRAFTAILFLAVGLLSFSASAEETNSAKPLVLAFYHPWYGTPWGPSKKWSKWDSFLFPQRYSPEKMKADNKRDIAAVDYPLLGPYDNSDPEVVRWHFRLAKAAGIDGFLCSWWRSKREWDQWQSGIFEKILLPIAQEENFKLAVIDEHAHYIRNYDKLVSRAVDNLPRLAAHPAYLKINGQPVWFIYQVWDDWLSAEEATKYIETVEKKCGDVFWIFDKMKVFATIQPPGAKMGVYPDWLNLPKIDCFGTYSYVGHWRDTNAASIEALYSQFADEVHAAGKKVQLPAIPGHNNTPVHEAPFIFPRENGRTLKSFLAATDNAKADIVVVCSWNEWLEGTTIEPSSSWDDPYIFLKTMAEWRGKKWEAPPLPPKSSFDPLLKETTPSIEWDPTTLSLIQSNAFYGRIIRLKNKQLVCGFDLDRKIWVRHSDDEGKTWKAPVEVAEWPHGRLTNTELLQLNNGSLLCFYNERPHQRSGTNTEPYAFCMARSDDNGQTWQSPERLFTAGPEFNNGCWEPAAIELSSGEVQLFFSNEAPYRQSDEQEITLLRSSDGARTWSSPEKISFRAAHRDGMPVPLILANNKGIAFGIEDNGLSGNFKPSIVFTSLEDNWRSGVREPGNSNRWSALQTLPNPQVAASAPYLRQMPSGETLLSFQQSETGDMQKSQMVVCIGDAEARHFDFPSRPFPPTEKPQLWNSLFVKNESTVVAVSETTINGVFGIWSVEGKFIRR